MRRIDRRRGGAPVDGGEPTRVAMGQHLNRRAPACAPTPHGSGRARAAPWHGKARCLLRPGPRHAGTPRPCGANRPAAGGSRRMSLTAQARLTAVGLVATSIAQARARLASLSSATIASAMPYAAVTPIKGAPAHMHGLDRINRIIQRAKGQDFKGMRQANLIDDTDADAVAREPDRPLLFAVNLHACPRLSGRGLPHRRARS